MSGPGWQPPPASPHQPPSPTGEPYPPQQYPHQQYPPQQYPHQQYPPQQYPHQPYAHYQPPAPYAPGYGPPAMVPPVPPRPPAPPLTPRQRRGALVAGGVTLTLATIGLQLMAVGAIGGVFVAIAAAFQDLADPAALQELRDFLAPVGGGWTVVAVLVGCVVIGLALAVVAPFASHRILRRHDVQRPWTVTLAGAGVGVVSALIISQLLGLMLGVVGDLAWSANAGSTALTAAALFRAGAELALVNGVIAAIGSFSWWWMAHALRR